MNTRPALAALVFCLACTACSKKTDAAPDSKAEKKDSSSKSSDSSGKGGDSGGKGGDSAKADDKKNAPDTVKIEPANLQRAGITIAPVEVRTMPQVVSLPAQVMMDEQHTSHVGALADGRIADASALPGTTVHRGQTLGHLHSHMVHETVGALVQAFAAADRQRGAVTFAHQSVDRYGHLYSIQAASLEEKQHAEQMLQQSNQDLTDAQANVRMEREHLSELLQVDPESLTPNNLYDKELVPIRSPIEGVVLERKITVGQVVNTGDEVYVVSNLATVWVTAALNEKDLSLVHKGAAVNVGTQGYPDTLFPGRVAMVGDTLDPETRTVPIRVVVPNPATRLRPGMFATAQIAGQQTRTTIFVPEDALQEINGIQVVFVTADGSTFKAQAVKLGTRSQGRAEVVEGLRPGDHVVVNGAFMIKSELLKGTMGDG